MSSWRTAAQKITSAPERIGSPDYSKMQRPYSRESRDTASPIRRSGMQFFANSFGGKNFSGPKTTAPAPAQNMWSNALQATMQHSQMRRPYASDDTNVKRPVRNSPATAPGSLGRSVSMRRSSEARRIRTKERVKKRQSPMNKKRSPVNRDVMADDLDALLAEIDGAKPSKPSPEIQQLKKRTSETRKRKIIRMKKSEKKPNQNGETKNQKLERERERNLTTDMEQLMSSIEDFGASSRQDLDEEDEEEFYADEGEEYEEEEHEHDFGYEDGSDVSDGGEMPVMEDQSESDDDPPEIVMMDDDENEPEPKESAAAAAASAGAEAPVSTKESVERNLGMVATKVDFDTSLSLGWDCNVEVGQMVIVQRSNGVYKYGLVSNFEDDEEGLAAVEFLVDIHNGERVIKRWDVEDRPFDVRVLQDVDAKAEEEEEPVLSVDQLDPEDEKLVQELFVAARSGAWREIQQFCTAEPDFSLDIRDKEGYTAVAVAAFYGHVYAVEIFLENGADPNLGDTDRCTPLHCAAQEGFTDTVSTLIRYKADVNMTMKTSGRTPLFLASQEGYAKVVKILLEAKARTDIDNKGCTPLFISVQESHNEITKLLLKNKADPDKASSIGTPPLLMAVQKEDLPGIRILLESGANVNKATPSGVTALSKAMLLEYTAIVRLLKSYGAIMDTAHGEQTLQEVAKRVASNASHVDWNDTARTAAARRLQRGKASSGYGMVTRTK